MKKSGVFQKYRDLIRSFGKAMPRFFKYQIVTKMLFAILLFPVFWGATRVLIYSTGMDAISNSQMIGFIISPQGSLFLALGAFLLLCGILLELCGFVIISSQVLFQEEESSYKELLKRNFALLPCLMEWGSLVLFLYLIVLIPLTNTGVTLSFLKGFHIPNFITSVIEGNSLFAGIYSVLLVIMFVLSMLWIFAFHFIAIVGQRPSEGLRSSFRLVQANGKYFLKEFIVVSLLSAGILLVFTILWLLGILVLAEIISFDHSSGRIIMMLLLMLQKMGLAVFALLFVPFETHHITLLFYQLTAKTPEFEYVKDLHPGLMPKDKKSLIDRVLGWKKTVVALLLLSLFLASIPLGIFFKEIFHYKREIQIVGHRGGGGFDVPENSLSSIGKSIKNGAAYVEIDVQRAGDGTYIIHHDDTFNRLAADARSAQEMTLKEIKSLDIGQNYPGYQGERVPTIGEVLDFCKGKIGIFIELKGKTADEKMMEDIVKMVRQRRMEKNIVLMSLDYDLIRFSQGKYQDMDTGFVYFLNLGDAGSFQASYIILEENAASSEALNAIHGKGKKAAVWTVNKEASMVKFSNRDVDAIITDDVVQMKDVIKERDEKTDKGLLLDMFFRK